MKSYDCAWQGKPCHSLARIAVCWALTPPDRKEGNEFAPSVNTYVIILGIEVEKSPIITDII